MFASSSQDGPHRGLTKRQLPLQEQLGASAQNIKGETQELDPGQQHERYLKAGQFSVETPGHVSMPPFMQAVLRAVLNV